MNNKYCNFLWKKYFRQVTCFSQIIKNIHNLHNIFAALYSIYKESNINTIRFDRKSWNAVYSEKLKPYEVERMKPPWSSVLSYGNIKK